MKSSQSSGSQISPASEYALILGAGATAAMSMAAQQVAVATLPVTTLVALGLFNRYRLDQRLQSSQGEGPTPEETSARGGTAQPQRPTAQPRPDVQSPRPEVSTTAAAAARFSDQHPHLHISLAQKLQARADFATVQRASLQSVGARLQQLRQEKGLSLEAIYQLTFIQTYSLRAIETGDLKQLPEPFYIRAFIQKYAAALGLDGVALAAEFPLG